MAPANGYGAISNHVVANDSSGGGDAREDDALLPRKNESRSLRKHMNAIVTRDKADLVLLFSYIITGLLDSSATAIWGSFVSMQTGNTVYLGSGLANPSGGTRWVKSGISIVGFCFGSFCFARFHRKFSQRRRWVLLASVLIQWACIVAAAVIVTVTPNPSPETKNDLQWHELLPIFLVAFQSSGQAVISRALQYGSLTSVVLTSIYCDLWSDPLIFAGITQNAERNRRFAAPILLLIGAMLGGVWSRSEIGMTGALWTAAALKLFIVLIWIFWKREKEEARQS